MRALDWVFLRIFWHEFFGMNRRRLERLALGGSVLVLVAAAWFWGLQVESVLELLALAYGE